MSLRWRIAAGLGIIAAIVSGFGAVGSYASTSVLLENGVDDSLLASARALNRFGGDQRRNPPSQVGPGPAIGSGAAEGFERPDACPPAGSLQPAGAAQVVAADGTVTVCIEGGASLPVDAQDRSLARNGGAPRFRTADIGDDRYRMLSYPRNGGGTLQVARNLHEMDDLLGSLRLRLAGIGIIGVAAAVLLGWFVARRIVRPVERLQHTAESIAQTQDLTTPVPADGTAEIGSLARSFTTMVDALASSRHQQQQLIRDASHELRTPLTSLQTNSELLARASELDAKDYDAIVQGLQLEVGELTALVSELVELATNDSGDDELLEPIELGVLCDEVVRRARRRSGRDIFVTHRGDDRVHGRPQMLTRAVSNLVENAIKYSPSPTRIEVVVDGRSVEVRDEGPGIPEEDLPRVFDRFYRSTRSRTEPGSGLGLAIVNQAIERHGGRVFAANRAGGGAVVGFELGPDV